MIKILDTYSHNYCFKNSYIVKRVILVTLYMIFGHFDLFSLLCGNRVYAYLCLFAHFLIIAGC